MKTVWKYPLSITDAQTIALPKGAEFLKVAMQNGTSLTLWAVVDPDQEEEQVEVAIFGTGHVIPDGSDLVHVDTVLMPGFDLVWHVFIRRGEPK